MVFFWDLWPEILNLEISHIYILLTMSSFSNISIKNWFLDTCFLNWNLANLGHLRPTLSIWLKKMPTIGLFDVKGTHSRYQLSYLIMKVIIWRSMSILKGYINWKTCHFAKNPEFEAVLDLHLHFFNKIYPLDFHDFWRWITVSMASRFEHQLRICSKLFRLVWCL